MPSTRRLMLEKDLKRLLFFIEYISIGMWKGMSLNQAGESEMAYLKKDNKATTFRKSEEERWSGNSGKECCKKRKLYVPMSRVKRTNGS